MLIKQLKLIYDAILRSYPDHRVIGEEGHGHHMEDINGVVVDPIDELLNFVHQQRLCDFHRYLSRWQAICRISL